MSRRTLIRICRLGQATCLLSSFSGLILILQSATPAHAQACRGVCESGDESACLACEQVEHAPGNVAAGSALLLGGLLGSTALGELCRGLEQGGGGAGGGGITTVTQPGESTGLRAGLVDAYGNPIDGGSPPSGETTTVERDEGGGYYHGFRGRPTTQEGGAAPVEEGARPTPEEGEGPRPIAGDGGEPTKAEGETFRGAPAEGGAPATPTSDEAAWRRQLLGADAEGRVYDANGQHVLNVDADGNVTDLQGTAVQQVVRNNDGTINHYIDANGNEIRPSYGSGLQRIETEYPPEGGSRERPYPADLPDPDAPRINLSEEVKARWEAVGAGPNGEMRAPDGSIIGRIDAEGRMTTFDGKPIIGTSLQEGGRLTWFNTPDGNSWRWDAETGTFRSMQTPDGEQFRPRSQEEWRQVDQQRADEARVRRQQEMADQRVRNASPEELEKMRAETGGGPDKPPPPGAGAAEDSSETRVRAEQEAGRTRTGDAGEADARTRGAAEGGPRPAGEPESVRPTGDAGGARTPTRGEEMLGSAFGRTLDVKSVQDFYNQYLAEGRSPAEAFSLAVAQTGAGNMVADMGIVDPRASAAAAAMLPGAISNVLPEQAVQGWIETGWDAFNALGESVGVSAESGELDTSAFNQFADGVASREGADPFKGIGQLVEFGTDEIYRDDGGGLVSDIERIIDTGVGSELVGEADQAISRFQQEVADGQHYAPLQGWNYVFEGAADFAMDPGTTAGQVYEDVKNIYNYGVGDGFWNEAVNGAADVIKNTPVADVIYDGYHQVFSGIADQGLGNFAAEMGEGAYALGGEAYDAVGNAASSTYDYIRSFF